MADQSIPSPRDGDSEDVHWALTTAASLQAQGEHVEALRWLRRAVEAAAEASNDGRAIELGKRAADLAQVLGGAPTHRGSSKTVEPDQQGLMPHGLGLPDASSGPVKVDQARRPLMDDLDEPTHVDSRPPLEVAAEVLSRVAESRVGHAAAEAARLKEEITLIPGTKKAAGIESAVEVARAAYARVGDAPGEVDRRPTSPAPAPRTADGDADDDGSEVTESMELPPNIAEIIDEAEAARTEVGSTTLRAATSVDARRVALVQIFDGGGPRVLPLAPGESAPAGAAVALLVPASPEDDRRVASMLGITADDGDERDG